MSKQTRVSRGWILRVLTVIVFLGLIAFGGLYFKKYQDLKKNPISSDQAAQAEIDRYIGEVGKLYALPKDEKPSVATVKDKEKLRDQPFFAQAENGDVTLIYSNAKLAILYRPSTSQIINVSSVTIQASSRIKVIGAQAAREAAQKGLTAAQIAYSDGGAAKGAYTKTVVVDVSGKNAEQAVTVAKAVGGEVGNLPAGEVKPDDADILVIAGTTQPAP